MLVVIFIFCTLFIGKTYPALQCEWSKDLDESDEYNLLGGQYSYKSNINNKREYTWKYCNINASNMNNISLPETLTDDSFDRGCGGNTALNFIKMDINNYQYQCSSLENNYILNECEWTNWLNDYNQMLSYQCHNNGLIRTIMSEYNKQKNDRRFKFECCMVDNNNYKYAIMNCKTDNEYRNKIEKDLLFQTSNAVLSGIQSMHDTLSKDRQFKLSICKPKNGGNNVIKAVSTLEPSVWEGSWLRTCKDRNNDNSVITGIVSVFDKLKQDRQFTIKCGNLNNDKYSLVNCGFTGYLNDYNGLLNFKCPNKGVIRSIGSQFMHGYDDRKFKVECCQIATNLFSDVVGEWIPVKPCHECNSNEYKIKSGIMSARVSDISNKYRDEIKNAISNGYEYNGIFSDNLSINIKISDMYADYTVNALNKELSESKLKVSTMKCDKPYAYQWRQNIKDMLPNIGNYDVFVYSNDILCSNNMPECPLGLCNSEECNKCKDNMVFNPKISAKKVNNKDKNTDKNKISTDLSGLYYKGINITKPFIYTLLGFIAIAFSCAVFIYSIKLFKFNNKKFVYKPVRFDATTTSNSDVTDIVDSVGL